MNFYKSLVKYLYLRYQNSNIVFTKFYSLDKELFKLNFKPHRGYLFVDILFHRKAPADYRDAMSTFIARRVMQCVCFSATNRSLLWSCVRDRSKKFSANLSVTDCYRDYLCVLSAYILPQRKTIKYASPPAL